MERTKAHRPVWPLGLCSDHPDAIPWPCDTAVAELVREYGDGWVLAAHLWDLLEEAVLLLPTMELLELRRMVIARPLLAVEAWIRAPRVVEHWSVA